MLDRARKTLKEDMTLDPNDLPDEMDMVRDAFVASVKCDRPFVRRHNKKLSTVPKQSSPR